MDARHLGFDEGVVFEVLDIGIRAEPLDDLHRQGALYGQLGDFVRCVVELFARRQAKGLTLFAEMFPVLFGVGSVDHQQESLGVDAVDEDVVHDAPLSVGQARILDLPVVQRGYVVRGDMLQEVDRPGPFDPDFAHVADVEYAGLLAYGVVFVVDAGEFDRHVESGKFGHTCAILNMILRKRGCFHVTGCLFCGFVFSVCLRSYAIFV